MDAYYSLTLGVVLTVVTILWLLIQILLLRLEHVLLIQRLRRVPGRDLKNRHVDSLVSWLFLPIAAIPPTVLVSIAANQISEGSASVESQDLAWVVSGAFETSNGTAYLILTAAIAIEMAAIVAILGVLLVHNWVLDAGSIPELWAEVHRDRNRDLTSEDVRRQVQSELNVLSAKARQGSKNGQLAAISIEDAERPHPVFASRAALIELPKIGTLLRWAVRGPTNLANCLIALVSIAASIFGLLGIASNLKESARPSFYVLEIALLLALALMIASLLVALRLDFMYFARWHHLASKMVDDISADLLRAESVNREPQGNVASPTGPPHNTHLLQLHIRSWSIYIGKSRQL